MKVLEDLNTGKYERTMVNTATETSKAGQSMFI